MQRWIANYEKEMSFSDFKDKLGINSIKKIPSKDIKEVLVDTENIINLFTQGGEIDGAL